MNKVFVFPGQGAQYIGMGKDFYQNFSIAKEVFEQANDVLHKDMTKIIFDADEEILKQTINTQPAIVAVEIAIYETIKAEFGIKPNITAGHSVGEASALYVAEIVSRENMFRIIQKRAELMDREAQKTSGVMYAVLGVEEETLKSIIAHINKGIVVAANFNTRGQIVVSGDREGINELLAQLKKQNIKHKAVELKVSGAWHSPLMSGAFREYNDFLKVMEFNSPKIDFISNVTGEIERDPHTIKQLVGSQIISSVQWIRTMNTMEVNDGFDVYEIGPGRVLNGLFRRYNSNFKVKNIEKVEHLQIFEGGNND